MIQRKLILCAYTTAIIAVIMETDLSNNGKIMSSAAVLAISALVLSILDKLREKKAQ